MLTLVNNIYRTRQDIKPTIFPDKTSQVWRLDDEVLKPKCSYTVEWEFESEAEIFHLLQLNTLIKSVYGSVSEIRIPFFPYARQDKKVSNIHTFSRETFIDLLISNFPGAIISALDLHSEDGRVLSISPIDLIKRALKESGCTRVCFPDLGALSRYSEIMSSVSMDVYLPHLSLTKIRNQDTGVIGPLQFDRTIDGTRPLTMDLSLEKVLIIDDICDGGATFIAAAKLLLDNKADEVYLYTTHGIYSKGVNVLFDAGIKRVFNSKGEIFYASSN